MKTIFKILFIVLIISVFYLFLQYKKEYLDEHCAFEARIHQDYLNKNIKQSKNSMRINTMLEIVKDFNKGNLYSLPIELDEMIYLAGACPQTQAWGTKINKMYHIRNISIEEYNEVVDKYHNQKILIFKY
jgi:hypothetical protein